MVRAEGQEVAKGQEIADIETSKIANAFESPVTGTMRRRVAGEGETLPVGGLLAVVLNDAGIGLDDVEAVTALLDAVMMSGHVELKAGQAVSAIAYGPGLARVDLANGETGERSGQIVIERQQNGHVLLKIEKHHSVSIQLPPSLARRMAELLADEAGPKKPVLTVVSD